MRTLYLMRHGQTLFNEKKKIQGWCDSPLTELGIKQALAAKQYFVDNEIEFDHAYSSTSERACDTLEIVTDHNISYERIKGLKEWNFGVFEGENESLNPKLPYADFFVQFGGESQTDLIKRVSKCILELMLRDNHQQVLMVSHGASCRNFMLNWNETQQIEVESGLKNCCILKFSFDEEKHIFSLVDLYNPVVK